jgi:hypothetical protein
MVVINNYNLYISYIYIYIYIFITALHTRLFVNKWLNFGSSSAVECCRVLSSVVECCRVLSSVVECCRVLSSVVECCRVLSSRETVLRCEPLRN